MNAEERKRIDKILKDIQANESTTPSPDIWSRIEQGLEQRLIAKRRRKTIALISSSLLCIAIGLAVGSTLWDRKDSTEPPMSNSNTAMISPDTNTCMQETIPPYIHEMTSTILQTESNGEATGEVTHILEDETTHTTQLEQPAEEELENGDTYIPIEKNEEFFAQQEISNSNDSEYVPKTTISNSHAAHHKEPQIRDTTTNMASQPNEDLKLQIPNVITPNGDGVNDCWVIEDINQLTQVRVKIFTSRGRVVYENSRYDNSFCGEALAAGNYFYILSVPQHNYTRRGVLVIIRD